MLEILWAKHRHLLLSIVRYTVGDPAGSEDILQDAYSRVLRYRPSFVTEREGLSYLKRTVRSTAIDAMRRRGRSALFRSLPTDPQLLRVVPCVGRSPLQTLITGESESLRGEVEKAVTKACCELPGDQKEAILLLFSEHTRSLKAICAERGIPYSTARSRMLAGVEKIRRKLIREGYLDATDNKVDPNRSHS